MTRKQLSPRIRPPKQTKRERTVQRDPAAFLSIAALVAGIIFLLVVLKNAWACDDAYIILRSLEQLMAGDGPVWNPHERVQAFTSPLWFWLLSIPRLVSPDVYLNAMVISLGLVAVTLVLVRRTLAADAKFLLVLLLFVCCNGFLDFTTSGLENPLAYFLIAFYLLHYFRVFDERGVDTTKSLSRLALAFGLVVVTRHDLLLLVLPSFVYAVVKQRGRLDRRGWISLIVLSCGPLAVWSLFALIYYGSIFPNTALAKLNAGIDKADLVRQGARYVMASLRYDVILVVVMIASLVVSFVTRKTWARWLAVGVLANVGYVVYVGGDFMLGRFLSFAYLVSVITLLMCVDGRSVTRFAAIAAIALITYAIIYPHTPVKTGKSYANDKKYFGIADERGVFFSETSIHRYAAHAKAKPPAKLPYFPDTASARKGYEIGRGTYRLTDSDMIGFFGYWAGTRVMIVDRIGLADPLLARLPAADRDTWRIGHFYRAPVPGYYESLVKGGALADPQLDEFYQKIKIITQGPLFSRERFGTIVAMNLGRYDQNGNE